MTYSFLDFELDTAQQELRRAGVAVPLAPKPFSVLEYLIQNNSRLVPKSELLDKFWPANVSEAALQTTIRAIRKSLGDQVGAAAIKTYHGRGFRFVAPLAKTSGEEHQIGPTDPICLRELRLVTVISLQIRAHDGPDDLLEAFLSRTRDRVAVVDGRLQRMMIDGFTAVFGLGEHADDGARRAVSCVWDLISSKEAAALGGAISAGVDTGSVMMPGESQTEFWTLPGEIERRAVQLAHNAPTGSIVLGDSAYRQLDDDLLCEEGPGGHVLLAAPEERAGTRPAKPTPGSLFVGRERELAFLSASAEAAFSGTGQVAIFSGPAGIGKSRLMREFLAQIDRQQARTSVVQCLPRMTNTLLALVRRTLLGVGGHPPGEAFADEIDEALYVRLTDPAAPPSPKLETLSEHVIRKRSRSLFIDLVRASCQSEPMVLVVEDAHWMDPSSRSYFEKLIEAIDGAPLLLLLTTRPTEQAPVADAVLNLPPLGQRDCMTLLGSLAEARQLDDEAMKMLVERSAGNPFFLEELAFASMSGRDTATDVPGSVQAVIETRIAGLASDVRPLLYAIAVIGPPAPTHLISALLNLNPSAVEISLNQLTSAGFLTVDEDGATFRHMLLHETAYAMISPDDRARLHGEVALLLEADQKTPLPETLAWHWQEAGEKDRAIDYWTKASNAALYRAAGRAAIVFAKKGLDLIEPTRPDSAKQEQNLQLSLAAALMTRLGYGADEVGQAYYRAHDLSAETGSMKARLRSLLGLWVHTWVAGRLPESLSHGRALLKLAEKVDDPALRLQGHGGIGSVLFHSGDLDAARQHLEAGVALVGASPPDTVTVQNAEVTCVAYCAWVAALQGRRKAMREHVAHCAALSERIANPFSVAIYQSLCSDVLMCAGDVDACAGLAEKAIAISKAQRYPFWLGTGLVLYGWALSQGGQVSRALELVEEGMAVFASTGARVQRANWFGVHAEVLLFADRLPHCAEAVANALDCAEATGDSWYLPRVHAVASRLQERLGDTRAAEFHATELQRTAQERRLTSSFLKLTDGVL
ncbi:hypothetical protein ATO1_24115 [Phaeobacter sp. 22II1-1F12B]|nr:hypothetical protein ATO1_24115 [Phaeobacter sp. 22II1-1F12B]